MKRYFIFLTILLCSCSQYEGNRNSCKYDIVKIEFDGYSKDYETKEKITLLVTDSNKIRKLNDLKNGSRRKWFANVKGTDFIIRLIYTDSETGEQLLVRILKSIGSTPTIEYGSGNIFDGAYKNEEFFSYIACLIKLEEIKQYEGNLNQEEYEGFN